MRRRPLCSPPHRYAPSDRFKSDARVAGMRGVLVFTAVSGGGTAVRWPVAAPKALVTDVIKFGEDRYLVVDTFSHSVDGALCVYEGDAAASGLLTESKLLAFVSGVRAREPPGWRAWRQSGVDFRFSLPDPLVQLVRRAPAVSFSATDEFRARLVPLQRHTVLPSPPALLQFLLPPGVTVASLGEVGGWSSCWAACLVVRAVGRAGGVELRGGALVINARFYADFMRCFSWILCQYCARLRRELWENCNTVAINGTLCRYSTRKMAYCNDVTGAPVHPRDLRGAERVFSSELSRYLSSGDMAALHDQFSSSSKKRHRARGAVALPLCMQNAASADILGNNDNVARMTLAILVNAIASATRVPRAEVLDQNVMFAQPYMVQRRVRHYVTQLSANYGYPPPLCSSVSRDPAARGLTCRGSPQQCARLNNVDLPSLARVDPLSLVLGNAV